MDAPTCKNVVIARVINSMTEFKQIIGRGTRVQAEYGKFFFNILDYTGSATRLFADPDFDGYPALVTEEEIDATGETIPATYELVEEDPSQIAEEQLDDYESEPVLAVDSEGERRKYYIDGGHVEIAAHLVYELDPDGKQLSVVQLTDYVAEKVRMLYPTAAEIRKRWADPEQRSKIIAMLEERGIDFDELAAAAKQPSADPFDLLCHIAFNMPLRTRRERADRLRRDENEFLEKFSPKAKEVLNELLDKYAEHGTAQFVIPDVLKVEPFPKFGNVSEIAALFGGAENLKDAVAKLQTLLYVA